MHIYAYICIYAYTYIYSLGWAEYRRDVRGGVLARREVDSRAELCQGSLVGTYG